MTLLLLLLLQIPSPAEADRLFTLGTRLVAEGDTAGAVAAWEGAQETGWTSAAVEHNLGTVALAQGDAGRARLHLERATRLAPLDAEIAKNVALARTRSGEPSPTRLQSAWAQTVASVRPLGLVTLALALTLGAIGLGLAGRQRLAVGVGLAAALAVGASTLAVWETTRPLGVAMQNAPVVEAPAPSASVVTRLRAGETLLTTGAETDGWRAVRVGRSRGWVRAGAVASI